MRSTKNLASSFLVRCLQNTQGRRTIVRIPAERYKHNAGAVFSLKYHLVWCPKYRKKVLTGPVEARLKELLAEKATEMGATIHAL